MDATVNTSVRDRTFLNNGFSSKQIRLFLLRHGQTEANVAQINQGHLPGKLSPLGEQQAQQIAERLRPEKFDIIIVSDLRRAKQTAAPIIATHPEAKVIYEPRIRERNQGVFEGKPIGSFQDHAARLGVDVVTFQPEGGESIAMMQGRAARFFDDLVKEHKSKTVLVVSHGGFLTQLLFMLLKKENTRENYEGLQPMNCALSVFSIKDDGNHEVELVNCVEHL
ncbi:histidine phosphatase family protein [Candidatus Woesearchaeota archaeon]|nr:histidine phosphatase family protein [Candidatus Woesearchaeota archaeon]